jgi:hypothetical protein
LPSLIPLAFVAAQFGNDEGHSLSHQTGDKGHVAGKPVQLGDNYAAFRDFGGG